MCLEYALTRNWRGGCHLLASINPGSAQYEDLEGTSSDAAAAWKSSGFLERDEHNLRLRSHTKGRPPRAGAPIRKDEHPAEAMQPMHIRPINSLRDPGAGRELAQATSLGAGPGKSTGGAAVE